MLSTICLVFFLQNISAQTLKEFKGTVSDENSSPIPFASVMILNRLDSAITNFAQTDIQGNFLIKSGASLPYLMKISRLGYKDTFYTIKDLISTSFTIQSTDIELNQYVVEYKEPIRIKSDTTVFEVASFSDGFERNLEEFLQKVPGVTVNSNGTIFFNGRAIDRILVEGDNFFSRNYKVLSKNIPTSLLESVEAIENFNDQRLLKGIEKSDKTVLNLRFQKGLRASLLGTTSIGAGLPGNYEGKAVLFSLLDRIKAGYIGNVNNTGQEGMTENEDFFMEESKETLLGNSYFLSADQPIIPFTPFIPNIPKRRYNINDHNLQALQLNHSGGQNYRSNTYGIFQGNQINNNVDNLERYFIENNTFDIREIGRGISGIRNIELRSIHEFELDSNSQLSLTFKLNNTSQNSLLNSSVQIGDSLSNVIQNMGARNRSRYFKIDYLRKLNPQIVLQSEVFLSKNSSGSTLDLISGSLGAEKPMEIKNLALIQFFNYTTNSLGNSWKIIGKLDNHQYTFLFHYGYLTSNVNSSLSPESSKIPDEIEEVDFLNKLNFENHTLIFSLSDQIELSRNSKLKFSFENQWFDNKIRYLDEERKLKRDWLTNYRIGINHNFRAKHKLFVELFRQNQISSPLQVFTGRVFTSANSTLNWEKGLNIIKQSGVNWRYNFFDRGNYWQLVLSGNHFIQRNPYVVDFQNNGAVFFNLNSIISPLSNTQNRLDFETNKMIFPIKSRIGVRSFYSKNLINRAVNGIVFPNEPILSTGYGFFGVSAFDGPINFRLESTWRDSRIKSESLDSSFSVSNIQHQASMTYSIRDNLRIKLSYESNSWENRTIDFLDIQVDYTPWKNRGIHFQLNGSNLLNNSELAFLNISNTVTSITTYSILPRLILLNLSFDIGRN